MLSRQEAEYRTQMEAERTAITELAERSDELRLLADQYLARGSWNEAADLARQIVDDEPQGELRALAGFVLGDALEQLGKTDEALTQFEAIRDIYPNPGVIDNRIAYLKKKMKE